MPSWIAPSLAADYWNISEDEVWQRIHSGELAMRREGDFYFVDVAPDETTAALLQGTPANPSAPEEADQTLRLPWIDTRRQTAKTRRAPAKAA
jgi:hypothetical protein